MKKSKIAASSLIIFLVVSAMVNLAFATDWLKFQNDTANSGVAIDSPRIDTTNPTGTDVWSQTTQAGSYYGIDTVPIIIGDYTYVVASGSTDVKLYKLSKSTGSIIWNIQISNESSFHLDTPASDGTNIYVPVKQSSSILVKKISNLGNASPTVTTLVTIADNLQPTTPVTYDNGNLYFGSWVSGVYGKYYCVNASTGARTWTYTATNRSGSTAGNGFYWAGAAVAGNYVIFGDDDSYIHVLNKTTGTEVDQNSATVGIQAFDLQTYQVTAAEVRSSICYYSSGNHAYFTTKGGYLWDLTINTSTGVLTHQWNKNIGYSTSTPVRIGNRIYVGTGSFTTGTLYCYDASGNQQWTYGTTAGGIQSSVIAYNNGAYTYLYFTTNGSSGKAYCVRDNGSTTSTKMWEYASSNYILQGMAASGDYVVFGNDSGMVYGIK
ncbi:MAG TPA: PQQ-binding-like beta-propeller repeat protein [Pseudobacteroides sp.]|uniref:outer membrane protein assembly factor BamB family protein n=1 Tax=Pseudobacteroides sp. TaxID=1968840 RepID=UPI002F955D6C